jgi:hypothetical protein
MPFAAGQLAVFQDASDEHPAPFLLNAMPKNYDEVFKLAKPWKWLCRAERPSSGLPKSEAAISLAFLSFAALCLCGDGPHFCGGSSNVTP